jgi:hypothetical protein
MHTQMQTNVQLGTTAGEIVDAFREAGDLVEQMTANLVELGYSNIRFNVTCISNVLHVMAQAG